MTAAFCPACRHSRTHADPQCTSCGVPRPPTGWPIDPMIGKLIDDKYRIDRRLSTGGFGTVFIATQMHGQQELGQAVLKFLHPELAHDPNVSRRFVTEAKAARELTSPHVVRVFDLGFDEGGIPFMVQEYVAGEGLDAIIKGNSPLAIERVVRMGMQVAEAMDEAHGKGILHRDLKPENLRIQQTIQGDFVKVLDFGIARVERGTSAATNSFIGTPRYMAPEQIKQKGVDARSDVFALGVIMFEMLVGEPPIIAESEMEYIHLNLVQEPRDVRTLRQGIPHHVADLVMRMMSKDKEARPASMAVVYATLRGGGSSTLSPSLSAAGPVSFGATVGGTGAVAAGQTVTKLPPSRRNLIVGAVAGVVLLVSTIVGFGVFAGGEDPHPPTVEVGLPGSTLPAPTSSLPALPGSTAPEPSTTLAVGEAPPEESPETAGPRRPSRPRRPRGGQTTKQTPTKTTGVQKIAD